MTTRKKNKLVCGVGINDADYVTQIVKKVDGKQKRIWICPFYKTWRNMLQRCYDETQLKRRPSYKGCTVCEEWLTFSNFKEWMNQQDYFDKVLDKDLLFIGNKEYSPTACLFVSKQINTFIIESNNSRGQTPIGVSFDKNNKRFVAACSNPFTGIQEYLGGFKDVRSAHNAWLDKKRQHCLEICKREKDLRIINALLVRYDIQLPA